MFKRVTVDSVRKFSPSALSASIQSPPSPPFRFSKPPALPAGRLPPPSPFVLLSAPTDRSKF